MFSKDAFEFREKRATCGNKGAVVGVMGGLGEPEGMRLEDTGNLFHYEVWAIISDEGLGEVHGVGM